MENKNDSVSAKKQLLLRLSPKLWNELAEWAEDDFRSINGQIEYLLNECVKKRKGLSSKEDSANSSDDVLEKKQTSDQLKSDD